MEGLARKAAATRRSSATKAVQNDFAHELMDCLLAFACALKSSYSQGEWCKDHRFSRGCAYRATRSPNWKNGLGYSRLCSMLCSKISKLARYTSQAFLHNWHIPQRRLQPRFAGINPAGIVPKVDSPSRAE